MRCGSVALFIVIGIVAMFAAAQYADAAPCRPSQSAAMLTGPVYDSIQAECNWVDAVNRRDPKAAAGILNANVHEVDAGGAVRDRAALLAAIADDRFGSIAMNVADVRVPFSAGSTNVVISTWRFHKRKHRVTDVFFCDVDHVCIYRLIAEQITSIAP